MNTLLELCRLGKNKQLLELAGKENSPKQKGNLRSNKEKPGLKTFDSTKNTIKKKKNETKSKKKKKLD